MSAEAKDTIYAMPSVSICGPGAIVLDPRYQLIRSLPRTDRASHVPAEFWWALATRSVYDKEGLT